ncbi:CPBP family intramembrane metalloprotease [archaeon]|nr:CPBP family intramembrane metalloprotease [archaeon]
MNKNYRSWLFIFLIVVAITALEYVFVYVNVAYGILLSLFVAVAIYVIVSIPEEESNINIAAESLALIPLYILFTSSLPWYFVKQSYLLPAVYSIVLALCFWHVLEKNLSLTKMGFTRNKFAIFAVGGVIIGISTGTIEYIILRPEPTYPSFELSHVLTDWFYMTFFVGVGEEMLFRGIIQTDLQKAIGKWNGLHVTAFLFGIMHMSWRSPVELVFATLSGYLLGYIYMRTNNLTMPIVLHGVNNTMLVGILPYLF